MRILLVDDEEGFLNIMEGVLRDHGYEVVRAEDGKQAREALEGEKFDLIISDVFMPTLDGVRFHSFVREFTDAKDVPFIFVSGYDDPHTRGLAAESPNDYFLGKTTPIEEMLALIDKLKRTSSKGPA
ncbi:MAG TPA: response regulator [Bacteroidota bacterium]|nr:response regulator [Bacteroidota bacterium]